MVIVYTVIGHQPIFGCAVGPNLFSSHRWPSSQLEIIESLDREGERRREGVMAYGVWCGGVVCECVASCNV